MYQDDDTKHIETIVIGGGQAGLAVGYHLSQRGLPFLILDANERTGDSWRKRWDTLRLFTPAKFNGLPGMPFPAPPDSFPTKDSMGDYLESYVRRFDLPVETGVRIERLSQNGSSYVLEAGDQRFEASNVIVAMANFQRPWLPAFANQLRSDIVQLHSADYRNPTQMRDGDVLVVGAGNSGSEIAMELSRNHRVFMSGRGTGYIPFRIDGLAGRLILVRLALRFLFHRVLTVRTPLGRKARPRIVSQGGPLIRVKRKDLARAHVTRLPRTAGVRNGLPALEDGRVMDVANVVWCTGFRPGFSWIDLPIHGELEPEHRSGVVEDYPGLYFVGLHFLSALSSVMIHGVGRDAERITKLIAARRHQTSGRSIARASAS